MYGDRLILCYMDTDSFILVIETEDVYKDLEKIKEYLDTSEFPVDHPLFSTENKKVVGKFSDESVEDGNIRFIKEYIALRSKMYYIDFDNTYAIENLKKKISELNSELESIPSEEYEKRKKKKHDIYKTEQKLKNLGVKICKAKGVKKSITSKF